MDFEDRMSAGDCDRARLAVRHHSLFCDCGPLCIRILVSVEVFGGENIVLGTVLINAARLNYCFSWR